MLKTAAIAVLILLPLGAQAYLPPSFYLAKKLTAGRDAAANVLAHIEIYRSAPSAKERDELLWEQAVQLPKSLAAATNPWPGLSILAESDTERMISAFKKFGLPVSTEEMLTRYKGDQLRAMKETPRPFYHVDPNMSLRRNGRTPAWVLSSQEGDRSYWVEKSSFFPLFLRGPCPKSVEEISWANSDEGPCELHFESTSGIRTVPGQRVAAVLKRDGQPLIKFVLKRTINNPQAQAIKEGLEKNEKSANDADDLLPLMNDFMN